MSQTVTARNSLARIVGALQSDPAVKDVRMTGSVMRKTDDEVSDLDLWVTSDDWAPHHLGGLLVYGMNVNMGGTKLFHGIDSQGLIVDICHGPEPPDYYELLESFEPQTIGPGSPEPESVHGNFWLNSYKHRKPLWRNLDGMALIGLHFDRMALLQAWVEKDTGVAAPSSAFTIHGLTPIIRDHMTPLRRELLGLPARDRRELVHVITAYREEMATMTTSISRLPGIVMNDPLFASLSKDV